MRLINARITLTGIILIVFHFKVIHLHIYFWVKHVRNVHSANCAAIKLNLQKRSIFSSVTLRISHFRSYFLQIICKCFGDGQKADNPTAEIYYWYVLSDTLNTIPLPILWASILRFHFMNLDQQIANYNICSVFYCISSTAYCHLTKKAKM